MTYKLIKQTVSVDAIQHLSDKHDEVLDDNPKHALELDRVCGELKGFEQLEKDGETFLVVSTTAVTEAIDELSDIHDDMADDNPDGAQEIDALCGELRDGLDMPFQPDQAVQAVQDALDAALDGFRDHLSLILPVTGNKADESQRVAVFYAINKLGRAIDGLAATDLVPGKADPEHDLQAAALALEELSRKCASSF